MGLGVKVELFAVVLLNWVSELEAPPGTETMDHAPVPTPGLFAASVAGKDSGQMFWSGPALEVVGVAKRVITTWSLVEAQGELVMVHWKVLAPTPRPVMPVVAELRLVIVPAPLTRVHTPVPGEAELAAMVAEVEQTFWSGPALAVTDKALTFTTMSSVDAAQAPPLLMDQRRV